MVFSLPLAMFAGTPCRIKIV
jgi:hypothetical protein